MITHAEVEAGAELCQPVGFRHAVEALENVQGLGEMQEVVLREFGGEDGEVGVLILIGGLSSVLLTNDVGVVLVLNVEQVVHQRGA